MGFDVVGMELNVPQFFGRRLSFRKFFSLNNDLVLVSKDLPIVYIMESKGALYDMTGDTIKQTLDLSSYSIPYGLEFLNYLINPSLSDEIFSNFINDDTLSITQQIYTSQDNVPVISFIHHFSQCEKSDNENVTSSEMFVNIFGHTVSQCHYDIAYPELFNVFFSNDTLLAAYSGESHFDKSNFPLFSMDSKNLYHEISLFFDSVILKGDWLNIKQKKEQFDLFLSNSRSPLLTIEDKKNYANDYLDFFKNDYFSSSLFEENSVFFPTTLCWASNYPDNMVRCSFLENTEDTFSVYFSGTDDSDLLFRFEPSLANSGEAFVNIILSKFQGVISDECIKFLKYNSISFV